MPKSKCTVRLLTVATESTYKVRKDNAMDPSIEAHKLLLDEMESHGYTLTEAIAPIGSEGTGTTPLGAVCLSPTDSQGPIIIAFRGTKAAGDVVSDMRIMATGVVEANFRNAAFEFYQKIQKANPGREIVLCGHSLGGHLAQYVATKAYNTNPDLLANPTLQVRTFNTAPVKYDS